MSIELCVLASGSAGNCTAVRTPGGTVVIDLGIGPRILAKRLAGTGLSVRDISAVCLTHLDRDHFNPHWTGTLISAGVRVYCHGSRVRELLHLAGDARLESLIEPFDGDAFEPVDGLSVSPIALAHDTSG